MFEPKIMGFLPPANEVWGKVIFSVACVKNSVHSGGGVCLSACWDTTSVPEQTPPRADPPEVDKTTLPPAVHAGRYSQQAGGMHPTGMQSCFWNFLFKYKKVTTPEC